MSRKLFSPGRAAAKKQSTARFVAVTSLIALTAAIVLTRSAARAQNQAGKTPVAQSGANFSAETNDVIVPVTATDSKGKFIRDLVQSDFHIFDEGREQKIDFFSHEEKQPVVIGFLIDMSNAMKIHWKSYQESTTELMLNLLPGEKQYSGFLITYGTNAELVADTSSDSEKMVEKLSKMKPGGGSALFDAIYMACTARKTVVGEPYQPRRVIIIIGDGHDTASKKTLEQVQEIAQRNLVTIYAMDTVAYGFHDDAEQNLIQLTSATGGRVVSPLGENMYKDISGYLSNVQDAGNYAVQVGTGGYTAEVDKAMFEAVRDLMGEITTQYVMRYHPDFRSDCAPGQPKCDVLADKQLRHIKVTVGIPNVTLRFREGYYPFGVPQ